MAKYDSWTLRSEVGMTAREGRRNLLIGIGATAIVPSYARAADVLTLVYVSAWDCPYCLAWKRDTRPAFEASSEYKKLVMRDVVSPTIKQAYKVDYWPEDLRWLRDYFWSKNKVGTPRFALARGNKLIRSDFGIYDWAAKMWPAIQKETNAS